MGCTAKDVILAIIGKIGTAGGTGYVIEYAGAVIRGLSMEGRMTVCNMSIEAGARAGLIAPDEKTFDYLEGRPHGAQGRGLGAGRPVVAHAAHRRGCACSTPRSRSTPPTIEPQVTWGTSPQDVVPITGARARSRRRPTSEDRRRAMERSLEYMGLEPGTPMEQVKVDTVFIGSCTNGRIEDLRVVAKLVAGQAGRRPPSDAMVVPGSGLVKHQAEAEGLDEIFKAAGFEWREAGCSMCLGMNPDQLKPGERCACTSNRNFEGRQGKGGRTHLVSPAMAAAAALTGHLADVRKMI